MSGILLASVGNSYGSLPVNVAVPTISGTVSIGSTLTSTTGTWTGAPAPTFTYQWQRGTTNISGATNNTYVIQAADAGSTLRCVVTATNPLGSASANSANTVAVPSGSYIAVASQLSPYFYLLDHTTPGSLSLATSYITTDAAHSVAFSPNDDYIAVLNGTTVGNSQITLLNHTTPGSVSLSTTYNFAAGSSNSGLSFSPNGSYLAFTNQSNTFTLLNHSSGSLSLATTYTRTGSTQGVSFTPDGNYIAVGGSSVLTLLNHTTPGTLSLAATYTVNDSARGLSFDPSGSYLAVPCGPFSGSGPYFTLLNHSAGSLSLAATYTGIGLGRAARFTPDGNYIAFTHNNAPYFTLLNHSSGSVSLATTYTLSGFTATASGASISPDGKYIVNALPISENVTLLDHTTAGSISLAATYSQRADGVAFSTK